MTLNCCWTLDLPTMFIPLVLLSTCVTSLEARMTTDGMSFGPRILQQYLSFAFVIHRFPLVLFFGTQGCGGVGVCVVVVVHGMKYLIMYCCIYYPEWALARMYGFPYLGAALSPFHLHSKCV